MSTAKTKLDKVTSEIIKIDNTIGRFNAVEIADYLLKKAGSLRNAIKLARSPYRIDGKAVW